MPATTYANRQWIYAKRPIGRVSNEHYNLVDNDLSPEMAANEVIVRARYISVDPYMRINQSERNTFDKPHPLGTVQGGGAVCQVIASNSPDFKIDDWVLAYSGWQLFAKCHTGDLSKLDPELAPVSTALGVLGMPGRTAWFGLMDAGLPKPGETVLVSGAAGAVGSLVMQFATRAGCKVYGIAGGADKGKFLTEKLGADGAIDYKKFTDSDSMSAEIEKRTGGVDIYFDNVGGYITDAVIPNIKLRGRIIICGAMSQYDGGLDKPDMGPRFLQHMLFKRATIQGILARDFKHRMDEMLNIVGPWVRNQEIVFEETFVDGFEQLPSALNSLFEGKSVGKLLVRV
jgi:NADPH-dependent curcumin reductase CurA